MTINQAAHVTGWSPRMLRYIELTGLVTRSTHAQLMEPR
jgi:hypothetical protein